MAESITLDIEQPSENHFIVRDDGLRASLDLARTYVRFGTHRALQDITTRPDGTPYDAVELGAGPYRSVVIGSVAMGRQILLPLEKLGAIDVGGQEYKLGRESIGWPNEDNAYSGGVGSSLVAEGKWQLVREAWRNAEYDPSKTDITTNLEETRDAIRLATDGEDIDLQQWIHATLFMSLFQGQIGYEMNAEEASIVAKYVILQESDMANRVRARLFVPKSRKSLDKEYKIAKDNAKTVMDEVIAQADALPLVSDLMDIHGQSESAVASEIMEMLTAARGLANGVLWAVSEAQPSKKEQVCPHRAMNQAFMQHPGASLTSRKPDGTIAINLTEDGEPIDTVTVGSRGRLILSSALWGRDGPNNDSFSDSRVFGVGRRSCPATKLSKTLGPEILSSLQENYNIKLHEKITSSGHGATESPRPHAMAQVSAL